MGDGACGRAARVQWQLRQRGMRECMCVCMCVCACARACACVHVRVHVCMQSAGHRCTGSRLKQRRGVVGVWGQGRGGGCSCTRMPGRCHLDQSLGTGTSGKAAGWVQSPVRVIAALRQRDAMRCPNRPGRVCEAQGRRMSRRHLLSKSSTSAMMAVGFPLTPRPPSCPPPLMHVNERFELLKLR